MNSNTTATLTFDLDLAYDCEGIDEGLAEFLACAPYATVKVLEAAGPAGWPLVRFVIPSSKLDEFAEAYGIDADELLELA